MYALGSVTGARTAENETRGLCLMEERQLGSKGNGYTRPLREVVSVMRK